MRRILIAAPVRRPPEVYGFRVNQASYAVATHAPLVETAYEG